MPFDKIVKGEGPAVRCRRHSQPVPHSFDAERGRDEENFIPRGRAGYRWA
jgi:hypothetical protein